MKKFDNVYIFVSDALRYDALPDRVASLGHVVPTFASSTISPTSFASIISGLHPPEHGVWTFQHKLDRQRSVLSLDGLNTSFWQVILEGGLYDVLGQDPADTFEPEEIDPPFVYVERELSTHAPYDGWQPDHFESSDEPRTIWGSRKDGSMWDRYQGNWQTLREKYRSGAETAADRFISRIEMLEDRGLLDDTLLIFTSDHGELLGEYGRKSHSTPVVEELVRVPTVIVANGINLSTEVDRSIASHVDIVPTIEDVLDVQLPWDTSGTSLFSSGDGWAYTEYHIPENATETEIDLEDGRDETTIRSVWDEAGGFVFKQAGEPVCESSRELYEHLLFICARHQPFVGSPWAKLRRLPEALRYYSNQTLTFGDPAMSRQKAEQLVERVVADGKQAESERVNISEEKKDHLEKLGYS